MLMEAPSISNSSSSRVSAIVLLVAVATILRSRCVPFRLTPFSTSSDLLPESRADVFRAVVQWHHYYDHPRADQQLSVLHRRFYWRSPTEMWRVVNEVCGQCPDCTARKRSTTSTYNVPSPLECGGRPFSVISVDPKPMEVADIDTGYDSILVITCRFSGYTLAIPHYQTDGR